MAFAVFVLPVAACAAVSTDTQRMAAEVANADWRYNRALEKSDLSALRDLLLDSYVFTDPTGRVSGKEDVINGLATGRIHITSQTTRDVRIEVFGAAAVETGVLTSKAIRDGSNSGGTFRFTRLWVKRDGHWATAAFQETAPQRQP